ncbi:hypothetical protein ZOSMA_73G00110 [Zostera marina]|uniref:Uncharacterized protein n=1 Tax=Zostera marina TaxID=29655 RepID=A0A0K9NPT9_ZOSMR|nr:hypothetical protein ZOSMA_73G00110 [Zostera marina]
MIISVKLFLDGITSFTSLVFFFFFFSSQNSRKFLLRSLGDPSASVSSAIVFHESLCDRLPDLPHGSGIIARIWDITDLLLQIWDLPHRLVITYFLTVFFCGFVAREDLYRSVQVLVSSIFDVMILSTSLDFFMFDYCGVRGQ